MGEDVAGAGGEERPVVTFPGEEHVGALGGRSGVAQSRLVHLPSVPTRPESLLGPCHGAWVVRPVKAGGRTLGAARVMSRGVRCPAYR
jgi:hypothetical protein